MEEKNCELLFEYLRSILYDAKAQPLDIGALDEPFRKLGRGLQFLDEAVQELKSCSAALSNGNLSEFHPSRDNFLCESLKNIHANLNHLTWQAKQVAKGDYSQTVSYLGEFSEAFNTMIEQLRERERALRDEAQMEKTHAEMVGSYNKMLLGLIRVSREDIIVTGVHTPGILYSSRHTTSEQLDEELYQCFLEKQKSGQLGGAEDAHGWTWDAESIAHRYYRVTTALMEWEGEPAYAHIIREVTKEKIQQDRLEQEAYYDMQTGIANRHYFYREVEELLQTDDELSFCYCDLDRLKYVNDTFGHSEGDAYIKQFTQTVKSVIRLHDVFARLGGDEFCIVLKDCSQRAATSKMRRIQRLFAEQSCGRYDKTFSFGVVQLPKGHDAVDIDEVVREADHAMYQQKKANKKTREP